MFQQLWGSLLSTQNYWAPVLIVMALLGVLCLATGNFTRRFWNVAIFKQPRTFVTMGMLLALYMVLGLRPFTWYLNQNQKLLDLTFLPCAIVGALFGPWSALLFGAAGDNLGYFLSGGMNGGYFPGYTLSKMALCFIFACLLYQRSFKNLGFWLRVALAQLLVVLLVHFGLGLTWRKMMGGVTVAQFFSGIKLMLNSIQFVPYVAIIGLSLTAIDRLKLADRILGKPEKIVR